MTQNDEAERPAYLIRKNGFWYRPNCCGYTASAIQAGRYTMAEAEKFTHPNGPDGPRDGMTFIHEDDVTCADYKAYRTQAERIAELEAERENDFMRGVSYGQANMPKGTFTVVDSPELVTLRARAEAAEADVARLREAIRHAHDTLYELNPCNYDHDEVCRVNDASVEVILSLAPLLGEAHGKTPEWWADRAALQPKEEDV